MSLYYRDEKAGIEIYHGDCLDVLPTLAVPAMAARHVITDPPYARDVYLRVARFEETWTGPDRQAKSAPGLAKMAAGAIGAIDDLIAPASAEIARLTSRWALVFSDVETCHVWRAGLQQGMRYVRTGAWVKPDAMPQMSGDRPAVGFEPCTIAHAYGPMRWNGGGKLATWTYNTVKGTARDRPDHPCPKPLPLMRELVSLFTDSGDIILDPFMGSGTTLRAAKDLGRRAIGIEIEERWCEAAAKRLSQEVLPL